MKAFPLLILASFALAPVLMANEPLNKAVEKATAPKHETAIEKLSATTILSSMEGTLECLTRASMELARDLVTYNAIFSMAKSHMELAYGTQQVAEQAEPEAKIESYIWPEFQAEEQADVEADAQVSIWPEFQAEAQPYIEPQLLPALGLLAE